MPVIVKRTTLRTLRCTDKASYGSWRFPAARLTSVDYATEEPTETFRILSGGDSSERPLRTASHSNCTGLKRWHVHFAMPLSVGMLIAVEEAALRKHRLVLEALQ